MVSDLGDVLLLQDGKVIKESIYKSDSQENHIQGLFKSITNSVVLRYSNGTELNLSTGEKYLHHNGFTGQKNENGVELTNGFTTIQVEYNYEPIGTYPLHTADNSEQLILENEALIGNGVFVETRISKYLDGQRIESALAYPTNEYAVKVPRHYVYANDNGEVYQMILEENQILIQQLHYSKEKKTYVTDDILSRIQPISLDKKKAEVKTLSATKSQAVNRAQDMAHYYWFFDPDSHMSPNSPPQHLAGLSGDKDIFQIGIPYKWGGMNGLDTGTSGTYINFIDDLNAGRTAGNINMVVYSNTVGIDCSGFISAAYDFGQKYGTSTLSQVFKNTTWGNME